ncbi:MAG: WYL domain-containing protein [Actinomycetota bacterium]|nr:WYL domain-containing protein [Actinomycetota bacterium]
MNRTDRLFAIVQELRRAAGHGRTAAWLAERFEVSTRTVKRDISALQQTGVPVYATGGPGGGYGLDARVTLPPLTFTAGEATAIAAALASRSDFPFGPDGRSALNKILEAMPPAGQTEATALAGRVWILPQGADGGSGAGRVLDEALRDNVVVVLDYLDARGRSTAKRPVEPLAFAFRDDHWYLLAWCRRRRAGRSFRFDRITAAWPTTEHFVPRDVTEVIGEPPPEATPVRL